MKKTFKIKGMHCNSCSQRIEDKLKNRVKSVSVSFAKEKADVEFDENKISEREIIEIIEKEGYSVDNKSSDEKEENSSNKVGWFVLAGSLVLLFFVLYKIFGGINLQIPTGDASLLLIFAVGLLTGFHCVSMCGGFVVSYTAKNALKGHKSFSQHLAYGGAKVVSYAVIGGIFGLLGGVIAFSSGLKGTVAILAGVFMIFYSLSMMGLVFFRRFQFNPKFLSKIAGKQHEGFYSGPLLTGLFSGLFIACGPLQAMYLYAMGSGGFFNGASALAVFGLGTLPIMLGFGGLTTIISHQTTKKILKVSAIIVLVLGLIMINRGLTVLGSPITYNIVKEKIAGTPADVGAGGIVMEGNYQVIKMDVDRYGWEPDSFILKKGIPVKWEINVKELTSCNNEIIVKDYGLDIKLKQGLNTVEFTPDKTGTVRWSCWMGMIPGSFVVTDTGVATQQQLVSAAPTKSGGSCSMGANGGGCGCGGGTK